MIVIQAIIENDTIRPQRVLTSEEDSTVTSGLCNGIEYIYYQGDEPIEENN
jgi:hypothetical protein